MAFLVARARSLGRQSHFTSPRVNGCYWPPFAVSFDCPRNQLTTRPKLYSSAQPQQQQQKLLPFLDKGKKWWTLKLGLAPDLRFKLNSVPNTQIVCVSMTAEARRGVVDGIGRQSINYPLPCLDGQLGEGEEEFPINSLPSILRLLLEKW